MKAYHTRRSLLVAAGLWQAWDSDPEATRAHIQRLRDTGASWREIGDACGLPTTTVWGAAKGDYGRLKASTAQAIRKVSISDVATRRRPAGAAIWRLRSLLSMGYWGARLADALNVREDYVSDVLAGHLETVPTEFDIKVLELWRRWWDKIPAINNGFEKRAATMARNRARDSKWPLPADLDDDDVLYDPGYRPPTSRWRQATGLGIADSANLPGRLLTQVS